MHEPNREGCATLTHGAVKGLWALAVSSCLFVVRVKLPPGGGSLVTLHIGLTEGALHLLRLHPHVLVVICHLTLLLPLSLATKPSFTQLFEK